MGRPRKTTNVKERTVYVYVPSKEIVDEWKQAAKDAKVSISSFVQEAMEYYLIKKNFFSSKQTLQDKYSESIETITTLQNENTELYRKLERMDTLLDRYEKQLKALENEKFLSDEQFSGMRHYNKKLIDLFKKESYLNEEMILDMLHIFPTDVNSIKAIDKQIENLLLYGIITPQKGGYVWSK